MYIKAKSVQLAAHLPIRGTKAGVRIGREFYPGAWGFGAGYVTKGGRRGKKWVKGAGGRTFKKPVVLRRVGSSSYPVEAVTMALSPTAEAIAWHIFQRVAPGAFSRRLDQQIEYRMSAFRLRRAT